jgi:hypothetical protein
MSLTQSLILWPGSPLLSVLLWIVVAVLLFYLARSPAHKAIFSLSRIIHNGMRLAARSVLLAEKRVVRRNREALLAAGLEAAERNISREFHQVDAAVKRDLSGYPSLQHTLAQQIAHIEQDYRESSELPPPPPGWVSAVDAVAKVSSEADSSLSNVLTEIHKTTISQYKNAMEDYHKAIGVRHSLLTKMMPRWRKVAQTLEEVDKHITAFHERAAIIDLRMAEYKEIREQIDKAERTLSASSMTQFLISALILLIAIGGGVINFNLVALPMSEMLGGGSYLGNFKTSNVAALVIIVVQFTMGLYLMEALRITRLFSVIGQMDDKMRTRMIWAAFSILLIMAGVEAALAFIRDQLVADTEALRQSLAEGGLFHPVNTWIPMVGQMVMSFILPFALTFAAIPLESFIRSSRTVLGVALAALLRWFAFAIRLLGNVARYLGELAVNLYDLLIFPPLWVETLVRDRGKHAKIAIEEEVR